MNANEQLREYQCTENYYKYICGLLLTDGSKAMADNFGTYWFLDIIASYQSRLRNEEFQVWKLLKHEDDSATVTCSDGNDRIIITQKIPWTDFNATEATLWLEAGVILLPSEN